MNFTISIPYRDEAEPLSAVAGSVRHLPAGEDRDVSRQIVFAAMERGVRTAGELLAEMKAATPEKRRKMLDDARKALDLPTVEDVEASRPRPFSLALPPRTEPTMLAHRRPDGSWYEEPIAAPRHAFAPSGGLVDLNEAEVDASRQRATEDSIRNQREAQAAVAQAEGAAHAESRRARDEAANRELPQHLRGLVA